MSFYDPIDLYNFVRYLTFTGIPFFEYSTKAGRNARLLQECFGGEISSLCRISPNSSSNENLFILGAGSSINTFDLEFEHIAKHTSIGVNFFIFHPFVANYYSLEIDISGDESINRRFYESLLSRLDELRNSLFFLKPRIPRDYYGKKLLELISTHLNFTWNMVFPVQAFRPRHVRNWLKFQESLRPSARSAATPNFLSSVLMIANYSLFLPFKKVILCGIDLQGNYFCDESSSHQEELTHPTENRAIHPITFSDLITILNENATSNNKEFLLAKRGNATLDSLLQQYSDWPL